MQARSKAHVLARLADLTASFDALSTSGPHQSTYFPMLDALQANLTKAMDASWEYSTWETQMVAKKKVEYLEGLGIRL